MSAVVYWHMLKRRKSEVPRLRQNTGSSALSRLGLINCPEVYPSPFTITV
jgi:hypothetical protein